MTEEFKNLKKGDKIRYLLPNGIWGKTVCTSDAYYNADCDEPGWEIETKACVLSIDNVLKRVKKTKITITSMEMHEYNLVVRSSGYNPDDLWDYPMSCKCECKG